MHAQECIIGASENNLSSSLSSDAKCIVPLHTLLEINALLTVARGDPEMSLPHAVEDNVISKRTILLSCCSHMSN